MEPASPPNGPIRTTRRRVMAICDPAVFQRLVAKGLATEDVLREAAVRALQERGSLEDVLASRYHIERREIGDALSNYYRRPFVSLDENLQPDPALLSSVSVQYMRRALFVPLWREGRTIHVAARDPSDPQRLMDLQQLFAGHDFRLYVTFVSDIERVLARLGHRPAPDLDELVAEEGAAAEPEAPAEGEHVDESDSAVVRLAQQLVVDARRAGASDIHIEPYPDKDLIVRFRVNGECSIYKKLPRRYRRALVSRLKLLAGLDIAERRKPQDGKLSLKDGADKVELRLASIPTAGGEEDVVIRVLPSGEPLALEQLGLSERNLRDLHHLLLQPYGIVLCVGPTGSGKTTTLHACLYYLNGPDIKIWTAEDPVEITQYGLRQVQVQPRLGFTFAAALRAFLRADPDVIMVGEMRDRETAEVAIEASMTGHLVLSTLHTNSAAETVVRLLDMGLDPHNFADSILGVAAQRLVRRLCPGCRRPYQSAADLDRLARYYGRELFESDFAGRERRLFKAAGCERCAGTGYLGRVGVHELLSVSEEVRALVRERAPTPRLIGAARAAGMRTLLQDGIAKCLAGETDYAQVGAAVKAGLE